jgi:CRP/FNR family transcriptional regulator, cyclic AMP receptor protein
MEQQLDALRLLDISPRSRDKLLSVARSLRFEEGAFIFREGDHALNLYVLVDGEVAIDAHIPPRGTTTVMTVEPGEWFGWSAMIEPRIETAAARALCSTEVLAMKGGALMDFCREDHEFGFELYRSLSVVIAERLLATRLQLLDMFATD